MQAPSGIAISTSTLVAHAIGGGHAAHARLYAHAAGCVILVFAGLEFLALELLRHQLVRVFTSDPSVSASFDRISVCVALFVVFDCFQAVEGGVLRGLGYQSFGAKTNGVVFYLLGLPLGFALTFHAGMGVSGLVIGLVCAVSTQTAVFFWRLHRIDWEDETRRAAERIEEEQPDTPMDEPAEAPS